MLRRTHAPLALLLLVLLCMAPTCSNPVYCRILAPQNGETIATFEFDALIGLAQNINLATLTVTLNGDDITSRYTAIVGSASASIVPGAPLLDSNTLEVEAEDDQGTPHSTSITFSYLPPKARAVQISSAGELLSGPMAHGKIGDFLIENSVAAFVVQDAPVRDLHGISTYGGNIIDAIRKDAAGKGPGAGLDHFGEIQPMANIETVLRADFVEVLNDGQDGTAAILRVTGPDDLWDYLNPSAFVAQFGVGFPAGADDVDQTVSGETLIVLEPQVPWARLVTTWMDDDAGGAGGGDIGMYIGDQLSGLGQLESWIPGFGVGEVLATQGTTDAVKLTYTPVGEATGAAYGLIPIEISMPTLVLPTTSFSTAGVTVVLQSHFIPLILASGFLPTFVVPDEGSKSFERYFVVGTDAGSIVSASNEILGALNGTLHGCVTIGGVAAEAGVAVSVTPEPVDPVQTLSAVYRTDDSGCYTGTLPVGSYRVAGRALGVPYEGGGTTPTWHSVTVTNGGSALQDIALPATGRLRVEVTDESSLPVPARVTVVGANPSAQPATAHSSPLGNFSLGVFEDGGYLVNSPAVADDDEAFGKDPFPFGIVTVENAGASGIVEFPLQPGAYRIAVSRGTEYSLRLHDVTVALGPTQVITTQIARVLDTSGFVSSDYHVHMLNSVDSWISLKDRVLSFAVEGTDNIIATDHDAHTPLGDTITALGLGSFVHSTLGEEVTSSDFGHFNGYPLDFDPNRVSGGSTDWAGFAPSGTDFPSLGNYVLRPPEIYAATQANSSSPSVAVQVNHIDSHFDPLLIDTTVVPPSSALDAAGRLAFRLPGNTDPLFQLFDALELWNGADLGAQNSFLGSRIGVWMNLLNQGLVLTAIADSDTHTLRNLEQAGARTWTPASSDAPALIDDDDIGAAVRGGKAVGGQGVYVKARVVADSTSTSSGFELSDPTLDVDVLLPASQGGGTRTVPGVTTSDGEVHLDIEIQAPLWAPYDTIEIYQDATTVAVGGGPPPTKYGATPDQVLTAPGDFAVTEFDPYSGSPIMDARRKETTKRVTLTGLVEDTWMVVVVKGSSSALPMFPVYPRNLDSSENVDLGTGVPDLEKLKTLTATESGVRALGFTNALYVDVDGNGKFDAP